MLPPPYSPGSSSLDASTVVPSFLLQQSDGRFGFAASTTTHIVPPGKNTLADCARSSQPRPNAIFSEHHLDPALRKEDDVVRQALHARLVGSDLEDSESSSSGTDIDKDKDDEEDDDDEGENNKSQQFG